MSEELKPCPFCGGEVELRHDHTTEDIDTIHHAQPAPDCPLDAGASAFLIGNKELVAAWNARPAPKADSALVGELREKAEQADAAKRNLHGLPVLAMESDTHKGKLALWCDNGLAGVGQTCVAVNLGEFPDEQIKAIAALANIAATTDFATILAALSDRDVVLEEAAEVVETWRESLLCQHGYDQSLYLAQAIRALKGGVDE